MLEVNVVRKTIEAQGVCSFELSAANGQPLPAFTAGAHIDVHIAPGLIRQYSLCNPPQERHRYVIAVLNEPTSRGGSKALHEQLEAGAVLHIGEPRNLFELAAHAAHYLLFAGGIGITPMLAMAHALCATGQSFELHYCCREPQRAAFLQLLQDSPFAKRVITHFDSEALEQRLQARQVLEAAPHGTHLYVCGPGGFMAHILDTANACGWPAERVHREYFAAPAIEGGPDQAFEVQIARSGRLLTIPVGRTVLEVLDEAGIAIDSSCEQGICGSCITGVLDGVPDHRDQFMTNAEKAKNNCFTPCCSRAKTARLVLDL